MEVTHHGQAASPRLTFKFSLLLSLPLRRTSKQLSLSGSPLPCFHFPFLYKLFLISFLLGLTKPICVCAPPPKGPGLPWLLLSRNWRQSK